MTEGFSNDISAHFGFTDLALSERNRNFYYSEASLNSTPS